MLLNKIVINKSSVSVKNYRLIRAFLSIVLLTGSLLPAYAQHIEISGNVKNESNEPLAGVNIVVKEKVIGTISNNIELLMMHSNQSFRGIINSTHQQDEQYN